jgi:hypothetical protein
VAHLLVTAWLLADRVAGGAGAAVGATAIPIGSQPRPHPADVEGPVPFGHPQVDGPIGHDNHDVRVSEVDAGLTDRRSPLPARQGKRPPETLPGARAGRD